MNGDTMDKCLLVSYIPLMDYSAAALHVPLKVGSPAFTHLTQAMDAYQNLAYGCMWVIRDTDNDSHTPVLIVDRATDLVAHMTAWAEQKPQEWFSVHTFATDDMYAVAVMPNLEKGVERWRTNYLMLHGEFAPQYDFKIIFKPVVVIVKGGRFNHCHTKLSNSIGFIDVTHAKKLTEGSSSNIVDHVIFLDEMPHGPADVVKPYILSMLEGEANESA